MQTIRNEYKQGRSPLKPTMVRASATTLNYGHSTICMSAIRDAFPKPSHHRFAHPHLYNSFKTIANGASQYFSGAANAFSAVASRLSLDTTPHSAFNNTPCTAQPDIIISPSAYDCVFAYPTQRFADSLASCTLGVVPVDTF